MCGQTFLLSAQWGGSASWHSQSCVAAYVFPRAMLFLPLWSQGLAVGISPEEVFFRSLGLDQAHRSPRQYLLFRNGQLNALGKVASCAGYQETLPCCFPSTSVATGLLVPRTEEVVTQPQRAQGFHNLPRPCLRPSKLAAPSASS